MAIFDETLMVAFGLIALFGVIVVLMELAHRKLENKFDRLDRLENQLATHLAKINEARLAESKDLHQRLEAIEDRMGVRLLPEAGAKEPAKERGGAHTKK